jgi:predicted esterase
MPFVLTRDVGFSQGAAVSLFTTLVHPNVKLGGIIALSGYIPCRKLLKSLPSHPLTMPVFAGHGTVDFVVQYSWHTKSIEFLKKLGGARITNKSYEGMQHEVCEEEITDVVEFINSCCREISEKAEL